VTAVAQQLAATELGAGRWRIELDVPGDGAPGTVSVWSASSASPPARVETLAAPPVSSSRWSVVITLDGAPPAAYELRCDGPAAWTARVELAPAPALAPVEPVTGIDYRTRDFDALREQLLARIGAHVPGPLTNHPVAQTTALVEQLAYLGDALNYQLDALATEAYLETARSRRSVTRHAALLDYEVFQGRSARAWMWVEVDAPRTLPARTAFVSRGLVFETLADAPLEPPGRPLELAGERHAARRLLAGATRATVTGRSHRLVEGALALLEPAGGEGRIGHVVRLARVTFRGHLTELEWRAPDAFPDDPLLTEVALQVRAGNLVLVEHGATQPTVRLDPPAAGERFRPRLPYRDVTLSVGAPAPTPTAAAAELLEPDGATARPAVELVEDLGAYRRPWHQRASLLESGPLARDFVVEIGDRGEAFLRFGDGVNGAEPAPGASFVVRQRTGCGAAGNVGPGTISGAPGLRASNPAAARGGAGPEALTAVKLYAPTAFAVTERVVAAADYVEQARRVRGVADAAAQLTSTGGWPLAIVYVHSAWGDLDDGLTARVRDRLDARRPAGVDLDVRLAIALPVTAELELTPVAGYGLEVVGAAVDDALRDAFLRPGRFGFGDALYRSELIAVAASVPGIADVTVRRLAWVGEAASRDALVPPFGRVLRIDNDALRPQLDTIVYRFRLA
jgi:hypothetical protein